MTLLVDRLRADPTLRSLPMNPDGNDEEKIAHWLASQHVPVYEISNFAHYLAESDSQFAGLNDFPNVAPPHIMYWMEWARPERLSKVDFADPPARIALLFWQQHEPTDEYWSVGITAFGLWGVKAKAQCTWDVQFNRHGFPDVRARSGFSGMHGDWSGPRAKADTGDPVLPFVRDREHAAELIAELNASIEHHEKRRDELDGQLDEIMVTLLEHSVLYPALMAHSFLACRNVEVEEHSPPAKVSRKFERRHGEALVKFSTLRVTPTKGRGGEAGDGLTGDRRLHIVRGHFKTFTAERPLMGHHVGTYWWTPGVRGAVNAGAVVKNYELAP